MTSILKVDQLQGQSGTTITVPSGTTLDVQGNATGVESGIVNVMYYTSSGTWTKATREAALGVTLKRVYVQVQGGGGGGNESGTTSERKCGTGGGYAAKMIDLTGITSATITVGSGGAGGVNTTGNDGGDSIWSDGTNTVTGGGGYGSVAGAPPARSTASGGDFNQPGQFDTGRLGSASFLGLAVDERLTASDTPGTAYYGAGGACKDGGGTAGAGGDGIVIVWEIAG